MSRATDPGEANDVSIFNANSLSRRAMMKTGAHAALAACADSLIPRSANAQESSPEHGIAKLLLLTTQLDSLARFYEDTLGLPVSRDADKSITVRAGITEIEFQAVTRGTGQSGESDESGDKESPSYHFAFNIPENKISAAQKWQRKRTPLLRWKGADKESEEAEIIHLSKWNAHSVFFRDPAGNLVEYIARHNLKNAAPGAFSSTDLLYASEIGLVTNDVPGAVEAQKRSLGLGRFHGGGSGFTAVGDEHTLLINVKIGRPWIPDKSRVAKAHPVRAVIRGRGGEFIDKKHDCRVSTMRK